MARALPLQGRGQGFESLYLHSNLYKRAHIYNKMKECPKCKVIKDLIFFGKNKNKKDGLQRVCKLCKSEYDKKFYLKNPQAYHSKNNEYSLKKKDYIQRWKKIFGKCIDCGIKDWRVLEFDHIRGEKKFNIGDYRKVGMKLLKEEIRKCECRCANCHRIKTLERKNY